MWPWMIETCLEPPSNITQVIKIWGEYYKDLRYKAIMWYMTKSFVLAQLEHSVTPMTRKIEINLRGKPCSNYCREHTLQTTESIPPRTASQTRNLTISVFWITNPSLQPPLPLPSLYLCKFKLKVKRRKTPLHLKSRSYFLLFIPLLQDQRCHFINYVSLVSTRILSGAPQSRTPLLKKGLTATLPELK